MKIIAKTMGLCLLTLVVSSCSKDNGDDGPQGEGSLECSYKVTIEGVTTLPNAMGQDKVIVSGNDDGDAASDYFAFQIVQSKGGGSNASVSWTSFIKGTLDRDMALGEYPVQSLVSSSFSSTDPDIYPLYTAGELSDSGEVADDLVFTLLENSDKRIRMRVSGTAMEIGLVDGNPVELGEVPVEAEISIATDLLYEVEVDGITAIGGICECQDQ